jgi:hypothetical protein
MGAIDSEFENDPDEEFSSKSEKDWKLVKGCVKFSWTSVW